MHQDTVSAATLRKHDRTSSIACSFHGFSGHFRSMHSPLVKSAGPSRIIATNSDQAAAKDGVDAQPSNNRAQSKTGVKLRRRLSAIFQRESHDK